MDWRNSVMMQELVSSGMPFSRAYTIVRDSTSGNFDEDLKRKKQLEQDLKKLNEQNTKLIISIENENDRIEKSRLKSKQSVLRKQILDTENAIKLIKNILNKSKK